MSEPQLLNVCVGLTLWLLPCAIQDYRTRHVSNWLTVPPFLLAWPVAVLNSTLPLTLAVFVGVYVAWALGVGLGPADGKIAVVLAAVFPLALALGFVLAMLASLILRLLGRRDAAIPGALWLYLGALLSTVVSAILPVVALSGYR